MQAADDVEDRTHHHERESDDEHRTSGRTGDRDLSHLEPDDEVVHDEEPGHAPRLDPAAVSSDDFAVLVVVRAEVEND